ncbi:MAG: hypothetical protein HQM10_03430 [Candidatus Riflebacteria bacterium]|nr:hypothetical protein [Candidatus Riflebacteria bacterium]
MNKPLRYLRMKTPADLLTVNFFASSGQLKGRFTQEIEPPWPVWWEINTEQSILGRLNTLIQGQIQAPEKVWEEGTPAGPIKTMSWLDLFRKIIIKPEETRKVANEVILVTADRDVLFAAIKNHFILQQGQFEFTVFDNQRETFLLKISHPSLWVFNTLEQIGFTWFNQVEGHSGIYIEAGWRINGLSGPECFNQFKVMDSGILLIQKNGNLLNLKPSWKKGESIIKVDFAEINVPQKDLTENLSIKPCLRKVDRKLSEVFWKIEDRSRLKAIISNESLKKFHNYRCWACDDGRIFILARDNQTERGLASILSDAFPAYGESEEHVMIPSGYCLAPKLSSDRLHKMFSAKMADYICFDNSENGIRCIHLCSDDMINIEDFITLEIESAIDKAKMQKPSWQFEFKELKKKKQLILIESKTQIYQKLQAVSENGQVGNFKETGAEGRKRRSSSFNLDVIPEIGDSETAQLHLQVEDIDRQLLINVTNSQLWQKRSEITRRMKMKFSSLASAMDAAVLTGNTPVLVDCALEFCRDHPELVKLHSDQINEKDKGRLLSAMRSESVSSEFHYALLLTYAAKFDDRDVFNQAVAGMKNGFSAEKRKFFSFNEASIAGIGSMNFENRVELLTLKDLPRISVNVKKLLQQIGCCNNLSAINVARMQLKKILAVNLDKDAAEKLIGPINTPTPTSDSYQKKTPSKTNLTAFFLQMIHDWPESATNEGLQPAVSRWIKLLTMEKIKETPLRDFFTGELYKPPFLFYRSEEMFQKYGILKNVAWMRSLNGETEFPQASDGKPIARAIFTRFSNGENNWDEFFKLALHSKDVVAMAKSQRLLLLMVSEYGPHPDFIKYFAPSKFQTDEKEGWDIFSLTLYCDMFRLSLAYRRPVDEQRLFNLLINRIPQPPNGQRDFCASVEWIILCLLLTSSPVRRFQLDNLTARAMRWLTEAAKNNDHELFAETLTVLCFLSIGTLADLVPKKLEFHQLLEKRKVFWIQHAFVQAARGDEAYKEFVNACNV